MRLLVFLMAGLLVSACSGDGQKADGSPDFAALDPDTVSSISQMDEQLVEQHWDNCKSLCQIEAECGKQCDYNEEPDCDEQANYDFMYAYCLGNCLTGLTKEHGACPNAAALYSDCAAQYQCSATAGDECSTENRRYYELCLNEPGWMVCFHYCTALEIGCIPYELVGYRGPDCEAGCKESAQDLDCLEAFYVLDSCMGGSQGYSCEPVADNCSSELGMLYAECEGWAKVVGDPEERAACAIYAVKQCECGLVIEDNCEAMAIERCLFQFGMGEECKARTKDFYECMAKIDNCDRDKLRSECELPWNQWADVCLP